MITLEESIPLKNDNYRFGESVFFVQFNEIEFYIEDEEQENFYYCIFKKIFPAISIEKIFPLNGKKNVLDESLINIGNKKKIYIVDKDFDDILVQQKNRENLFYLERYSIENYLVDEDSFVEYIIGENPKKTRNNVRVDLKFDDLLSNICSLLKELICLYILIQQKSLGVKNIKHKYHRFFQFSAGVFSLNASEFNSYKNEIELKLLGTDRRIKLNSQTKKIMKRINFDEPNVSLTHMPGKYLLGMLKQQTEYKFKLSTRSHDSFCYHIADKCTFESLDTLKKDINDYIIV